MICKTINNSYHDGRSAFFFHFFSIKDPHLNGVEQVTQWQGLLDLFNTSIYKNTSLSNTKNFNYFWNFLTDSAYFLISGLLLNSKSYREAVNVLKERFSNKQTLVFPYMESFVQLPVVKNSNNVINLRKFYGKIKISIRKLDSLDLKKETFRNLLTWIINDQLPEGLRLYQQIWK